ncbi:MAG: MG2 domain-containing protein [Thermotogota bacterium]
MKKILLTNLLVFFISIGFSYVYIQGQNVLNSGDPIYIKGYNETQVFMKIYKVENDIKVIMNRGIEKEEKKIYMTKILNANKTGNIDEKIIIKDKGLYYIEFVKENKIISSDSFFISNLNFISSYDGNNLFLDIRDVKNNFVSSDIYIVNSEGETVIFNDKKTLNYNITDLKEIYIKSEEGIAFKNYYFYKNSYPNSPIEFLKDKPIYKNNQEINFNIYSFEKKENYYILKPNTDMVYTIKDPAGNKLVEKEIRTNELGVFSDSYFLSENTPFGYYSVSINSKTNNKNTGFIVENYEKPTYEIDIKSDNLFYDNDTAFFDISLNYFDGNPVSEAEIKYYIYYGRYPMSRDKLIYDGQSFTNDNGKLKIPVKVDIEEDGYYNLEIISIDPSQKQMEENIYVKVIKGKYKIEILNTDDYYLDIKEIYKISLQDRNDNKITGKVDLEIKKEVYEDETYTDKTFYKDKINVINGEGEFKISDLEQGFYTAKFEYNNSIKTYYFNINENNNEIVDFKLEIIKRQDNKLTIKVNKPENTLGYLYLTGLNIYEKIELKENQDIYNITIPKKILEKNIFVEAIALYNGQILKDNKSLDMKKEKLNYDFEIIKDKDFYKPGEEIKLSIKTNTKGIFNISIVDEALYKVHEDNYDMIDSLYPELYSSNLDLTGRANYFYLRNLSELSEKNAHRFASYKGSGTNENIREYFPDNALWIPFIEIDKEKNIVFKNPDSLTRWKVNVLGISNEKIEKKEIKYKSKKDFYITPYIPEYYTINDMIKLNVRVVNNTQKDKVIKYRISSEKNLFNITTLDNEIKIQSGSSKIINFDFLANSIGKDKIVFDFEEDIVKLPVEIISDSIDKEFINIKNSDEKSIKLYPGEKYRSFSIENIITDNISFLDNYEYRCSEQTVSTLIPIIEASNSGYKIEKLDKKVVSSLQILYKYQQEDGGWGWWMNSDKSDLLISTYVLEALHIIQENGYQVSKKVIDKGLDFLKSNVIDGYSNYILSLYDEAINIPLNKASKYDLLFMSFYNDDAFDILMENIKKTEDIISYDINNSYTTDLELNSYLLKSMVENNYNKTAIIKLMNNIINLRTSRNWFSTKDTAIALRAILKAKKYLNLSSENNDFITVDKETLIDKNGIIEVLSEKNIIDEPGKVKIEKEYFKKFTTKIQKEKDVYLIDYFLNTKENLKIQSIDFLKNDDILKKPNFSYVYIKNKDLDIKENLKYNSENSTLYIYDKKIEDPRELLIHDEEIYILDKNSKLYKFENGILFNYEDDIISMSIYKNKFIYISEDNTKKYLNYNGEKNPIEEDIFGLDTLNDKIYLFGNYTYIFDINNNSITKKYPFVSKKIVKDENNNITFFGGIKFYANKEWSDIQGVYQIKIQNDQIKIQKSDILKTKINIDSDVKEFLTLESYIPSNSQLLEHYKERKVTSSGKYYNYWYTDWNHNYTSYEFKKNKMTFFSDIYTDGDFEYYFKILSEGEFYLKPDFAYNMYLPNSYGINNKIIMKVE